MPPLLALIICIIFIFFLLKAENRRFINVSLSTWIPTIYFLLISSKPLGIWFGMTGATMEEGSSIDRIVLSTILVISILILKKRRFNWSKAIKDNQWLMILLFYMLISILWSDMPFISFKRWTRNFIAIIVAFLVSSEGDPFGAIQSILKRSIFILIPLSYILIHYFPEYGREYGRWSGKLMWIGVASQKNGLALLCIVSIFYLIWDFIRRKNVIKDYPNEEFQTLIKIFLLFLAVWLFMGPEHTITYSATSLVSLILGLALFMWILWLKRKNTIVSLPFLFSIILLIIIYGTITPYIGRLSVIDITYTLNRSETLTERTAIWNSLIPYAIKKQIIGYGFGGFWTDNIRRSTSSDAHNGYLDLTLNLGIIGLIFFTFFLISYCKKLQKLMYQDFYWGAFGICFLIISVINNITESSFVVFTGIFATIILFLMVSSRN